ncbi:MAG: N-acetyl-gamma-glutamyl-phosphate reductase [Deltaproteobacteria bacterium]|nr:N-acetyl-gamma-glutamyl-phosphate reductase [Deltaproteobacteria bacterium]
MAQARSSGKRGKLRVAVLGATGYTGVELLRLLTRHPRIRITVVSSQQFVGKRVGDVYPSLAERCDLLLEPIEIAKIVPRIDFAFAALPHETSIDIVAALIERGKRVVDLSADFRLHDPDIYAKWYRSHNAPHLLREAVYGLPEIHYRQIAKARLVANPGCYPTAAVLGLAPLFAERLVRGLALIDAKSGTTGAGRSSSVEMSFSEVNENFKAYNVGVHRHAPEIEQELGEVSRAPISVLFVPHLVPMNRGILSTMYVELEKSLGDDELSALYRNFYDRASFVRVLSPGFFPQTKDVRGSNECLIGFRWHASLDRLIVITAIDNLVKGAAGQAVQNMNLMYGWPEIEGLRGAALIP